MVQDRFSTWKPQIDFVLEKNGVELWVQREDQMDNLVSGNKIYKLREHLKQLQQANTKCLLTFGGAYSNHIAATASICNEEGIHAIGLIRGERIEPLNPTLQRAEDQGMELNFISRGDYRRKEDPEFLDELRIRFDRPYIVPEGGADLLGIQGARRMVHDKSRTFDALITPVGTATTVAGLAMEAEKHQRIIGIPIHKHETVFSELVDRYTELESIRDRIEIHPFHLGGYAKWNEEHLEFIREFYDQYGIPLDPIYTSKAMRCTIGLIEEGTFSPGTRLLFIHTGGLQAVPGFEARHDLHLFKDSI